VIVTQGTDTIEEVSFFLDLALDVEQPVIVTGAMRNPSLAGADGPANLLAAVQVARSEQARKLGVLVVFNDEIHAARFVAKQHTTSVAAFVSPNAGKIGWVSEGRVIVTTLPKIMGRISPVAVPRTVNVPIIPVALDLDPAIIGAVAGLNVDGLVVEAVGGGHCAPRVANELKAIAVKMPVILSSCTDSGQVLRSTYGFSGGEIDLLRAGLIDSGLLDGRKSRILLSSALRSGISHTDAIAMFENFRS
jgi:L-asparaginase